MIGNKLIRSGLVSLVTVLPNLPELLALGVLEHIQVDAKPSGYALVLRSSQFGEFGEVVAVDDLPDVALWEAKGFLLRLFDPELNDVCSCDVCNKHYLTRDLLAAHKERTGHRRKYSRREARNA